MMKSKLARLAALAVLVFAATAPAQDNSTRDLIQKMRAAASAAPFVAKITLTSDRGWQRQLEMSHKRLNDDTEATYMEVTGPMDLKGTRFLVLDHVTGRDEQFIYVPAVKRSIQVGAQTRKQPFLGSEFAVGDFVEPDPYGFTYSSVEEEDVGGRHCKLLEAVPKVPADEIYGKTVFAVDPKDGLVMRRQFFDDKGKLLKVWTAEKIEKVDGVWTTLQQLMTSVPENHWSRIQMSDVKYNAEISSQVFSKSYLTR